MRLRDVLPPLAFVTALPLLSIPGCLDRPVVDIPPSSTRLITTKISVRKIESVDLLLVVDDSSSMKDKQSELGRRIPELLSAITSKGIDPDSGRETQVLDVHVGVITSSLGDHGTGKCTRRNRKPADDRAHLLPRPDEALPQQGFRLGPNGEPTSAPCPAARPGTPIVWARDRERRSDAAFVGDDGALSLQAAASCVVQSAGDDGCGYEATWEAIHRFLVDPAPYGSAKVECSTQGCSGAIKVTDVDGDVLAQRKAFLRDDSLLAILILSDENDFSLKPEGPNWRPWRIPDGRMSRGWEGCAKVPDDVELDDHAGRLGLRDKYKCWPCFDDSSDPACNKPWATEPLDRDASNLRGFQQLQRFGWNALWSRQRYVDAFTRREGAAQPLFAKRSSDMVLVAGIVGVPKTLVADDQGRPRKLGDADWAKLVDPDPSKRDPHMIESIAPRAGLAVYAGDRGVDPVHGGERAITDGADLQYACIGPRSVDDDGGDCSKPEAAAHNPLCDAQAKQTRFKAYPGLRHLRILRSLGDNGVVASICAESYRPAIQGIAERIRAVVDGQCLRSSLTVDDDGEVPCSIMESFATAKPEGKSRCEDLGAGYCTPGSAACRRDGGAFPPLSPAQVATTINLRITSTDPAGQTVARPTPAYAKGENVYVDGADGVTHLVCEIAPLASRLPPDQARACVSDPAFRPATGGGWCYSRERAVIGERCLALGAPGRIRFFGDVNPRSGSEVFTTCIGR
jgi:hypothetical protein